MCLPVQAARVGARVVHTEQNTAHVLKGVVFRAQMLFNRLHF